MDKILFQRTSGGWEYHFSGRDGDVWRAFAYDMSDARTKLQRILGWDAQRFNSAEFIRF